MKKIIALLMLVAMIAVASSCEKINNKEVPSYAVRIDLGNIGLWTTYGVTGVGDYRFFDRFKHIPGNFPYNVNTATGYGGVLLIMGFDATLGSYTPIAFDAACPVENQANVSVGMDATTLEAVCPKCNSRYNVLTGGGGPVSGQAHMHKYGLRMLGVHKSEMGGYIITSK